MLATQRFGAEAGAVMDIALKICVRVGVRVVEESIAEIMSAADVEEEVAGADNENMHKKLHS